jgi:hypothetical protein
MAEFNSPPCPTHGYLPRALHPENFRGAVDAIVEIIDSVSGVGTISYTKCPYGYEANFGGLVRALEDLNASISGIAPGVVGGSGVYITESGGVSVVNADYGVITSGGLGAGTNVVFTYVPGQTVINTSATLSGAAVAVNVQDTAPLGVEGTLWYDTNQGRLFVYASGDWYKPTRTRLLSKEHTHRLVRVLIVPLGTVFSGTTLRLALYLFTMLLPAAGMRLQLGTKARLTRPAPRFLRRKVSSGTPLMNLCSRFGMVKIGGRSLRRIRGRTTWTKLWPQHAPSIL